MSIEAMKQALEALEENHHLIEEYERPDYLAHYDRVITSLRQAIAEAGQEQIIENYPEKDNSNHEWVGLTDEEVVSIKMAGRDLEFVSIKALRRFAKDIEAKLKEKNT